jgi:hypothetical protein
MRPTAPDYSSGPTPACAAARSCQGAAVLPSPCALVAPPPPCLCAFPPPAAEHEAAAEAADGESGGALPPLLVARALGPLLGPTAAELPSAEPLAASMLALSHA